MASITNNSDCKVTLCNNCKLCNGGGLNTNRTFTSNVTNKTFSITSNITCKSTMFIYVITCKHPDCKVKYVGKSTSTVRKRMYGHRNNMTAGKEPHLLQHHFTKVHNPSDICILPIEIVQDGKELSSRETFWMRELNSIFPFGLNDRTDIKDIHDAYEHIIMNRSTTTIYSTFNHVQAVRNERGPRGSRRSRQEVPLDCEEFLMELLNVDYDAPIHHTRNQIMSLTKTQTKDLYIYTIKNVEQSKYEARFNEYFMWMVKDICLFKLQRFYEQTKTNNFNFLVINFANKLVENVNLKKILSDKDVCASFPHDNMKMKIPNVSYSYTNTIRSKIVNYKETIHNLDALHNTTCPCSKYDKQFTNDQYGHIFTGDLSIIPNIKLRSLLQKGLNYRDQEPPNKKKAYDSIQAGIESYITAISHKTNVALEQFSDWREKILNAVKENIDNMNRYKFHSVLREADVKTALAQLHEHFVLTPIDKASNNVSIICKQFYIDTLRSEVQNSNTFKLSSRTEQSIFNEHVKFYQKRNIEYIEENQSLPYLYWTSKMHKVPPKFRFITCGTCTSLENMSKVLSVCLKRLLKFAKCSAKYHNKYKSYNSYFIVDDRREVLDFITKTNFHRKFGGAKNLRTYDFSNLYTSIPHDKLKANVRLFVNEVFDESGKLFINVKDKKAYLSNTIADLSFSAKTLVDTICFLIDNCYIKFDSKIYQQVLGIPMGTSCAPYLANIFLYIYEKTAVLNLVNQGKTEEASKLANIFRYQDDCIVLNDRSLFDSMFEDIYPEELTLLNTNVSPCKVTFLDLTISLHQGKFKHALYDKRNDFDFSVITYPFLSGNIPKIPAYGVYISQLLRICQICSEFSGFKCEMINLHKKLVNQGFELASLKRKFGLFCRKYVHVWGKYGMDLFSDVILNALF